MGAGISSLFKLMTGYNARIPRFLVKEEPDEFVSTHPQPKLSSTMTGDVSVAIAPTIRKVPITRFRGIENITWRPSQGMNVILGGGDVGKTTILDALALLLSPSSTSAVSEADYWRRDVDQGFVIEAVMFLPEATGISTQVSSLWPWEWDGEEPRLPQVDENNGETSCLGPPVYCLPLTGTPEFELVYELVQLNGEAIPLTVGLRRAIGLVRLGGDDRNDRDLRLVYGSALDRLLSDKSLRARLGQKLAESPAWVKRSTPTLRNDCNN